MWYLDVVALHCSAHLIDIDFFFFCFWTFSFPEKAYFFSKMNDIICLTCLSAMLNHRNIELFRLKKASPLRLSPAVNPALLCSLLNCILKCHITYLSNASRDGDCSTSLGCLFQCLTTFSVKKVFVIYNLNMPWHNLRAFPLILLLVNVGEETTSHSATASFLVVVESDEISPQDNNRYTLPLFHDQFSC